MSRLDDLRRLRDLVDNEIAREQARNARRDRGARAIARPLDDCPEQIVELVADDYGITTEVLTGPGRSAVLVDARAVAMWIARDAGLSAERVGALLGRVSTGGGGVYPRLKRVEASPLLLGRARRIRDAYYAHPAREGGAA